MSFCRALLDSLAFTIVQIWLWNCLFKLCLIFSPRFSSMSLQLKIKILTDTVQNDHNIQHLMSLTVLLIIDDLARCWEFWPDWCCWFSIEWKDWHKCFPTSSGIYPVAYMQTVLVLFVHILRLLPPSQYSAGWWDFICGAHGIFDNNFPSRLCPLFSES